MTRIVWRRALSGVLVMILIVFVSAGKLDYCQGVPYCLVPRLW